MLEMTEEELVQIDKQEIEYEITMLEERLKQMTPNMAAIEEYKRKVADIFCCKTGLFFHSK